MAFLSRSTLESMGFAALGENVLISEKASIYGCGRISLSHDVRIDDFAVLSAGEGGIDLGAFVHVAGFSSLVGRGRITMADFSGLS
ncbi:MAG: acyltransferase, partial [Verrucomicrobiota bacterium]